MSVGIANDSECENMPSVRPAILVHIGEIELTTILDDDYVMNAIHKNVFKQICEQDNESCDETAKNIELDLAIDGRSITVVFRILPDLYADMILGQEFFCSVNAHIHLELRLLKWSYQNELVVTEMLGDGSYFRALSGGSDALKGKKSSEKVVVESAELDEVGFATSQDDSSNKKKRKKKKKKKKSKKTNETPEGPSCSSDTASIDKDLQRLNLESNKPPSKNGVNEVVKIFIAERELCDMLSGECLAYYGIYSTQKKISVLKGEVLKRKEKTRMGYSMEALHDAFGEAEKHGIDHLHIIFENEKAVKLMIRHQERYEKFGEIEPEEFPAGAELYYPDDFIKYCTACFGVPGYSSLKFEYISHDDETYEEMVHIRNLLNEYVSNTPL